jgi:cyclase
MLKKRIIPCLDIKDGRTVKGTNFVNIVDAGDPVELAKRYAEEGADELVFLDITATVEKRATLTELVMKISSEINIPFTVGGGINSVDDVRAILKAGADKISVNSSAVKNPQLIRALSDEFGAQCVVLAIDAKWNGSEWKVYTAGGRNETTLEAISWAKKGEDLGAGEILLTSMDHDGTGHGFAIELLNTLRKEITIPIIASGGAGDVEHFHALFEKTGVTAGLAAGIFHREEVRIPELKKFLKMKKVAVRWK